MSDGGHQREQDIVPYQKEIEQVVQRVLGGQSGDGNHSQTQIFASGTYSGGLTFLHFSAYDPAIGDEDLVVVDEELAHILHNVEAGLYAFVVTGGTTAHDTDDNGKDFFVQLQLDLDGLGVYTETIFKADQTRAASCAITWWLPEAAAIALSVAGTNPDPATEDTEMYFDLFIQRIL